MRLATASLVALLALLALPGCYLSHELGADAGHDLGVDAAPDAGLPDAMVCAALGTYLLPVEEEHRYYLAGARARLEDVVPDAAAGTLTFELFVEYDGHCVSRPGCTVHVTVPAVVDLLSELRLARGMSGQLDLMDGQYMQFVGSDDTRTLELGVGWLPLSTPIGAIRVVPSTIECSDVCNDYLGVRVEGHDAAVHASASDTARSGPLVIRLSSAYEHVCLHCGCSLPDVLPSGLVYAFTGPTR